MIGRFIFHTAIARSLAQHTMMVLLGVVFNCAPIVGQQPNIVIINLDDMGWGDFGAYGSQYSQTPNINELAAQGTRFTQFYSGAPICSPSRAALFTGQYAARSNINSFINNSTDNYNRDVADSLSLDAPSIAQTFHDAGYTTGHFGKWHLGGGRDVGYQVNPTAGTTVGVPRVVEYGYDSVWTQMEGLGNRIINVVDYGGNENGTTTRPSAYMNGLNQASDARGTGGGLDQIVYLEREFNVNFMVNRAIDFIDQSTATNPNQPFFMNVWLDETHTPHDPPAALRAKYNALYPSLPQESRDYLAVLEHTDSQIGRLVDYIDQMGLGSNTLILVTSDNGATGVNANNIDSTGPFRGTKGDLFEGGIRQPLIARWTGNVAVNRVDTETVLSTIDLFPTLTHIAGVTNPVGVEFDGQNMTQALLGNESQVRTKSLFWNMNRGQGGNHANPNASGAGANGQEVVALRSGNWKLLLNAAGSAPELYNVATDLGETNNLALQQPAIVQQMASEALAIRYSTPSRILPDSSTPIVRLVGESLASLGNAAAVTSWSDQATGDTFNGTVTQSTAANRPRVLTNALNGQAVVEFDGNDYLQSSLSNSLPNPSQGITVMAVTTADGTGDTAQRLAQIGHNGGLAGRIVGLDVSSSPTSTSNGGAGFRFNNGASLYDTPIGDSGFHIVVWQVAAGESYSNATMYVDGTVAANTFTGSSNNASGSVNFSGNDLQLLLGVGRNANGTIATGDYFTGQIAEFLMFNEQLTVGQINLVASYLSNTYDLPFAYETNLQLFKVEGLSWVGGTANFDSAFNAGDGNGGALGSNTDPFAGGNQNLFIGHGGFAQFTNATNTMAGSRLNSLRVGTARSGFIVTGTEGSGTLTATGSKSLTIGSGSAPVGGAETGDLIIGEAGYTGTVNWGSTGTLKVEGRLRIGEGGTGILNQDDGIITAGDVAGSQKFIAIGNGTDSNGTYNLNNGRFLPGGGTSGSQLRQVRIGVSSASGTMSVGDGIGAASSASVETRDDFYVGYNGGNGLLTIKNDGRVLINTDDGPVSIGFNAGSYGRVDHQGGSFTSDGTFTIGENNGATGIYELSGGTLSTAADGAGAFRVGRNGGKGTLRISGTGSFVHAGTLTLADGGTGTEGLIELVGSTASATIGRLNNLASGASETIRWVADANGITPLVINATAGANRVQLQAPDEVTANTGTNGSGNLMGDGTALLLDLSALAGDHTLTLIDNQTPQSIVGFFELGDTGNLFEEGETILGTGFNGTVTISYLGGTGNDVTLSLVAATSITGDHNGDGFVDAADYVLWRKTGGNAQGYADWRTNFGTTAGNGSSTQVPEPAAWGMVVLAVAGLAARRSSFGGSNR